MKSLVLLFSLFCLSVFGQSKPFEIYSYVTKDSVYVKWIPTNAIVFQQILKSKTTVNIDNNGNKSTLTIEPFSKRKNSSQFSDTSFFKALDITSSVEKLNVTDKTSSAYTFAIASILTSTDFKTNLVVGNLVVLPNLGSTVRLTIAIDGLKPLLVDVSNQQTIFKKVEDLKGSIDQKKTIEIIWNANQVNTDYLGFQIEKKLKGDSVFKTSTVEPYVHMVTNSEKKDKLASYRDDSIVQGSVYVYRLGLMNYFGQIVGYSNEIEVKVPVLVNANPLIDTIIASDVLRSIQYSIYPESETTKMSIDRIELLRSTSQNGQYELVNSSRYSGVNKGVIDYRVPISSGDAYYYKLLLVSQDNDSVATLPRYFFTLDQIPPKPISDLSVLIDSLGIARLSWEQTTDTDLQGFKLFKANSKQEEFAQVNEKFIQTKSYTDTLDLNNLSSKVYYFVVAVDDNYNNSFHSDTIMGIKPDTIPPVPSEIISIDLNECQLMIKISPTFDEDLKSVELIRSYNGSTSVLFSGINIPEVYKDSLLEESEATYFLITTDLAGNKSYSKRKAISCKSLVYPAIIVFNAQVDREKKSISLTWEKPAINVFEYTIYRRKEQGKFIPIITLIGGELNYEDKDLYLNTKYEYMISYQAINGKRSKKSTTIPVSY